MILRTTTFLLGLLACAAAQDPELGNHRSRLPVGQGPAVACLTADFDGDGLQDLARATAADFGVWLQDRGGVFRGTVVVRPTTPVSTAEIACLAVGRFTQPKFPDLVVGHRDGRVLVYPNLGGRFAAPWVLPVIAGSTRPALYCVLAGDVDGAASGLDELVLVLNQELPVVYTVQGPAAFQQARIAQGPLIRTPRAVLADLDRDRDLDLLIVTADDAAPVYPGLFLNAQGTLGVDRLAFPTTTTLAASRLAVADVLGIPGEVQLLLGPTGTAAAPVRVARNTSPTIGQPSFTVLGALSAFALAAPRDLAAADVDGDGYRDLLAIDGTGEVVFGSNLAPKTPGAFAQRQVVLDAAPRSCLCPADLEGDQDVDLVVAGAGIEDSLLLASKSGLLPVLDTESLDVVTGQTGRNLVGVADLTGEGDPDLLVIGEGGLARVLSNLDGQARFGVPTTNPPVPSLPAAVYTAIERAAVTSTDHREFLVRGTVTPANTSGMRVLTWSNGGLIDDSVRRWNNGVDFHSFAAADLSGARPGSAGTPGRSDVVGVDAAGYVRLVVNRGGVFDLVLAPTKTLVQTTSRFLVADVNLDQLPDVVVIQPGGANLVLLGDPKYADTFVEIAGPKVPALDGLLEDLSGDTIPDLVLAAPAAVGRVVFLRGVGDGTFADQTAVQLPKLGTDLPPVATLQSVGSTFHRQRSVVLGFASALDRIMVQDPSFVFGAPAPLALRGSDRTRQLLVEDLDLDGDDDLVVGRHDSLPAIQLGESVQFSHEGIAQAGRLALLRVTLPDLTTVGFLGIGWPVARVRVGGMGILRLLQVPLVMNVPVGPGRVRELRLQMPASLGTVPVPMQLATVQTKTGALALRNLDVFLATQR